MAEPEFIPPPTIRVVAPKPRMTVYYALLIIAFLAMLTACIFLYMVIRTFGGFGAVQGRVTSLDRPGILYYHKGHEDHKGGENQIVFVPFVSFVVKS
jgi:hypothetical protein